MLSRAGKLQLGSRFGSESLAARDSWSFLPYRISVMAPLVVDKQGLPN